MSTLKERYDAIWNGIRSLLTSECKPINCAYREGLAKGGQEAAEKAVKELVMCRVTPTLEVYEAEATQKDMDIHTLRVAANSLSGIAESVIANQSTPPDQNPDLMAKLRAAYPNHPFL